MNIEKYRRYMRLSQLFLSLDKVRSAIYWQDRAAKELDKWQINTQR